MTKVCEPSSANTKICRGNATSFKKLRLQQAADGNWRNERNDLTDDRQKQNASHRAEVEALHDRIDTLEEEARSSSAQLIPTAILHQQIDGLTEEPAQARETPATHVDTFQTDKDNSRKS